jgi:histidine triad (HIT) family protein
MIASLFYQSPIVGDMAENSGKACIFCEIVEGRAHSHKIYEDDLTLSILDAEKMMHSLQPDFVCMFARGRRIPHTHIFLVPTYSGDVLDRFFNALELFQESPPGLAALRECKSMEETAESIRKAHIKPGQTDQI